ncbi:MAG: Holliday junction branch migration protein RuvA [Hyphomicrobiales bacterium]|nr:Holliday junction branch migration protein RuvA [Hyphomicrobiales bacterium]MCP5371676.1 Holliday junction branch migration protein RuvA [Hyphomicrobiales bacterium]
MIAKLSGVIDSLGPDWAVIDVGGVGYLVACSGRALGRLSVGEHATLLVETQVREDAINLYGFAETAERDWFRLLTTVQGVGAKVALAILTVLAPDALMAAIAAGDRAAVTRAAGVGPKLATRILSELKDKVGGMALGAAALAPSAAGSGAAAGAAPSALSDAVSALVNLGYAPSEALAAASRAARLAGDGAPVEALIRGGLAELAPRESL